MKKIVMMGLGYIGLPTAALAASKGMNVIGVDINASVVKTINEGLIHFIEPGLADLVNKVVSSGHLRAALQPQEADAFVIVVPTPFKGDHEPDISYVESASLSVLPFLKEGDLFIIESTSPVHTTEHISELIFRERPELRDKIFIAYCPERVLPGNVLYELEHNDRVIGGINQESTEKAIEFYSVFVSAQLHQSNSRTAEMCKLTENSSRDVQIAFANELSLICNKADINVWDLIQLANKHPRVNILQPACGVGGHCIAVDPWFIVSDFRLESRLISSAREINNYKSFWCAEKVESEIFKFEVEREKKPRVALMGLAFKPDIDDLRESPAKYIVQKVMHHIHNDDIYIVEPNLKDHKVFKLTNYLEAYTKADIVVFLVAHKEFKTLVKRKDAKILDFCGIFK